MDVSMVTMMPPVMPSAREVLTTPAMGKERVTRWTAPVPVRSRRPPTQNVQSVTLVGLERTAPLQIQDYRVYLKKKIPSGHMTSYQRRSDVMCLLGQSHYNYLSKVV